MDQIDLLLVLAQIGGAVAGFASLATVVGQSYTTTDPQVNSIRLRGLLHIAIAVMLLSLIAVALLRVNALQAELAWRIASLIAFFTAVITSVGVLRRDRSRRRLPGYNRFTMVINFTIMGVIIAALGTAVTGLAGAHIASLYVGSLILMLVACSTAFMLVVTSFLDSPSRKDTPAK